VAPGLLQEQPAPERAAALGARVFLPAVAGLSAALVRACRARGLRVIPWTVRRDEEADAALRLGVDGIIADDPHLVRSAMARAREEASR
jgi:glycerophosphoryl diester phosphodiesterase